KFQAGGIVGLTATIRFSKVSNTVTGTDLESVPVASSADSGTTFRYDPLTGNYVFNLSTTGLTAGTYQIAANLGDGVWHTVNVSLKK
ncbi:MAG TPA: PxKF domain-containing protein, partial [Kofleriaceae bacterium]|nr:PxKF domain-containing protein [Kofleriaceae bacterium]